MSKILELHSLAEAGDLQAQYDLGNAYRLGDGTPNDDFKATLWYRKAAEQGHVYAIKCMENACRNGLGLNVNLVEAAAWSAKINRRGEIPTESKVQEPDCSLDSDLDMLELFKSLNNGDAESLYRVGVCYEEALLLHRDIVEAHAYYSIGSEIDDISARSAFRLGCIEREMSLGERNRSHKRTIKLKKQIEAGRASPLVESPKKGGPTGI